MLDKSARKVWISLILGVLIAGVTILGIEVDHALGYPGEPAVEASVVDAGIPVYPGATSSEVPDSLKLQLNIADTLWCEGYLTEAAPEEVMNWYQEHMGDWVLDHQASFSPEDHPEVTIFMHYYRKGEEGAFIFAQGGFMGQTLLGTVIGPWTTVQQCGGYGGPSPEGEMMYFRYPIDLADIDYEGGGIGPFGMHAGDHSEGLDHIWVYCKSADTPARATADGVVEYISGEPGKWQVIIKHSERFKSEYYLLNEVLVQEGQEVKEGDPVGYPIPVETWVPTYFFDYWLLDMNRNDGVWVYPDQQIGSRVSLYEYLEPEWKEAIENAYLENMYNPYKSEGIKVGVFNPYEPDLTNEIFVHRGNEGTPVGVWISFAEKREGVPSIITILKVNNEFYSGYRFIFNLGEGQTEEGSCEINDETGEITFHVEFPESKATTYYGIFEVTEGPRDLLRLEYREGSPPSHFSDNALNFVIRSQREPGVEMSEENIPPEEPSEPSPSDSATDVPINATLSWISGDANIADVVAYDVYFGVSETPPLVSSGQWEPTYDPGQLDYNTKYYWKIVAKDLRGAITEGPTWKFTTEKEANNPPVASFTYTPEAPVVDQTITFDASSSSDPDGTITNYHWDFGDGNTTDTTTPVTSHSYSSSGDYTVELVVTDNGGLTSSISEKISVKSKVLALSSYLQVDFGEVPSGVFPLDKGIKHRFTVKNTGDSPLTVDVRVEEVDTGELINIWPQPPTLYLSPGEQQWVIVPFLFDYQPEDLIRTFGPGQHTYSLKYTFTDHYDPTNRLTLVQDYTFTVLDPEDITGEFTVQGKVVDKDGQPIQDANVSLSTGNWSLTVRTQADGSFLFSVPPHPNWWLRASKGGYKDAYAFNLSEKPYTLILYPFFGEVSQYDLTKQVTTDIGFWKGVVSADEQYILLCQGMEIWADPDLKSQSKLMLYTLEGERVWEYPMGWEAWGADLSEDGRYAVYVTQQLEGRPDEMGLLDAQTGTLLWKKELTLDNFPPIGPPCPISKEVQFSHNAAYIGIGMGNGDFYLLDRETGEIIWGYFTEGQVRKILFTGDDSFVYVGSGDGRLYKFATNDGSLQWATHIWSWPYTYGLALSPDESLIAAGVKTGEVSVIRTSDGTRLWDYDLGIMCVRWVQFSPDGKMLAAGSGAPGGTTIFNATDGTPLWRTCFSGAGMFTSDGEYVLLGDGQGKLYTADGTLVASFDPGFTTAFAYWKVAYISRDKSKMVFAARDMEPGGVGIAFFKRKESVTVVSAPSAQTDLPAHFSLSQNYPNPFNSATLIRYYLPHQTDVLLEVYDLMGQRVAVLAEGKQPRGEKTVRWDARGLASGLYFYRLVTDGFCEVRKALLLR